MKNLLLLTAVLEVPVGIALLVAPSLVATILLGVPLDSSAGVMVGRVAGAALLAVGIICQHASRGESRGATGVVMGMLVYNVTVAALLVSAHGCSGMRGVGLWPAAVLHAGLAIWCVACMRPKRPT